MPSGTPATTAAPRTPTRRLVDGEFGDVARYWLCDHDFLTGQFTGALAQLQAMTSRSPADEGERLRLIGHIQRVNARFDDATATYQQAVTLAHDEGLAAAQAKALTNIAQTACWTGNTTALTDAATEARALLELVPNAVELVKLRSAEATALARTGDTGGAADAITETRRLADDIGYRGGHNLADVAAILLDVRTGDSDNARRTLTALDERTRASGGNTYWVPITQTWLDSDAAIARGEEFDWLDGTDTTLRHWAAITER
jgi:hypothetical protein